MEWSAYQAEALKTAPDHDSSRERLVQAALGLASEAQEFADRSTREELGDVCWYFALTTSVVQMQRPSDIWLYLSTDFMADPSYLTETCCQFAGAVESWAFQQGPSLYVAEVGAKVGDAIFCVAAGKAWDIESIMADNIDKLSDRHGDTWCPADEQDRGG